MKVVVTLLVVVVTLLHYGEAVKCYNKKVVECGGSCFIKTTDGDDFSELGCDPAFKNKTTVEDGVTTKYCNGDKCNSAVVSFGVSFGFNLFLLVQGTLLHQLL
ncbi:uncharacterized protein LOC121858450 [Homarus americanus]|uniref:Uncharacterized protein n=1 Tax=Homarus americanus TaxID=6706 RepID=A0A8J5N995_HOMAM|nr:uncharacterized protein LOC121858450 [Homarus americanus]KAG7175422.1 hypothetical protein Hamer_G001510 [Homarus americanus]